MHNHTLIRKVLIVTAEVSPTSAQGIRYINLVQHLNDKFEITHITYNKELLSLEKCTNISVMPWLEMVMPKVIKSILRYALRSVFFPDEYIPRLSLYRKKIRKFARNKQFDIVIICMTPFSFISLGEFIRKLIPSTILIADFSDPFSANATYTFLNKSREKAKRIEMHFSKFYNHFVVLNDKIKDYYISSGVKDVITIEQGVDEQFSNYSNPPLLEDELILSYAGGFYKGFRDPKILFRAINEMNINLRFNIYGGSKKSKYDIMDFDFINQYKHIPQRQLISEYQDAHVLVLIDNFYGIQVPGKTLECLTYNRPVLLIYENEHSPTLDYARKAKGVIICRNTKAEIMKSIKYIKENYNSIEISFDFEPYLWSNLANKLIDLLSQDVKNN